jgi:hypothetical protein
LKKIGSMSRSVVGFLPAFTLLIVVALGASSKACADEPFVGLWYTTLFVNRISGPVDRIFQTFNSDQTELQNDTTDVLPIGIGNWSLTSLQRSW